MRIAACTPKGFPFMPLTVTPLAASERERFAKASMWNGMSVNDETTPVARATTILREHHFRVSVGASVIGDAMLRDASFQESRITRSRYDEYARSVTRDANVIRQGYGRRFNSNQGH